MAGVEQGFVTNSAGSQDTHNLAFYRALAGLWVADLFTDGN